MNKSVSTHVLRVSVVLILFVLLFANAVPAHARTVYVPANVSWFDTGLRVEQGYILTISATGTASTWPINPTSTSGPDGQSIPCPNPDDLPDPPYSCLLDGAPYGALIGRIGSNPPFKVGAHYQGAAPAGGTLYLGVNDYDCPACVEDNQGGYDVQITLVNPDAPWCVSADGSAVGCAQVTLSPAALTGDFYLGEALLAQAQNPGLLVLPPGPQTITVRNIQSTESGFGALFTYADTTVNVNITEAHVLSKTVYPRKNYIRGTLKFTCDVKKAAPTDLVSCRVTIDGAAQQPDVAPGQTVEYYLDPGARVVLVEIVGDQANLFDPANKQQTVDIKAGKTTNLKVTFTKKGHLFLALNQTGVVGDFYVDDMLFAAQVASADMWVSPGKSHKAEVRNLTDPAANGVYKWKDASKTVTVAAGAEKTVTFNLQKQYLKGFLELTCDIKNYAGEDVACSVSIDGAAQAANIAAAQKATYTLDPGSHTVVVTLTGAQASLWAPASTTQSVTITASATPKKVKATFKKAGHLIVNLDQPGVVGDFYLDGTPVGTQVATIDQWVTPSVSHKIEVKNLTDPAANGLYRWKDATASVTVGDGKEKTLTIRLVKEVFPAPTPVPSPIVKITSIFYDGAVPYVESDEYAVIKNTGSIAVDLAGWRLNAGDTGQDFWFPSFVMEPGKVCRVYTNEYHPEYCGFSFNSGKALWNNDGDCGYLYNASGVEVHKYCY